MSAVDLVGPAAHGVVRQLVPLVRLSPVARRDVLAMAPVVLLPVVVRILAEDEMVSAIAGYSIPVSIVACVFMGLFQHWMIGVRVWAQFAKTSADKATHFLVEPQPHRGLREVVAVTTNLERSSARGGVMSPGAEDLAAMPAAVFDYQHTRYCSPGVGKPYEPLAFPVGMGTSAYHAWGGLASDAAAEGVRGRFGLNELHMPPPTFGALMLEHALAPFFVFQIFCVGLWCLDEYWYYSLFTLFMLVSLEAVLVTQRVQQHSSLRAMRPIPADASVLRGGKWSTVPGDQLVPGDIVEVRAPAHRDMEAMRLRREAAQNAAGPPTPERLAKMFMGVGAKSEQQPDPSVVPADVLLLRGSVVVNEAMLTGESIPQLKEAASVPAPGEPSGAATSSSPAAVERWLQGASRNLVLSGTSLISSSPAAGGRAIEVDDTTAEAAAPGVSAAPATPNGGALGVVLRTGFYTSQGSLMRTIIFSTRRVTVENKDAYLFIAGLLVFAIAASGYVLREGLAQEGRDTWKLVLHCILVITSVVPPELPVELSMAVNNSLASLARKRVFCTEPFRIPNAGTIDVCCFDKTGTLTSDQLLVRGVAYCKGDALKTQALRNADRARALSPRKGAAAASATRPTKAGLLETADARASLSAAAVTVVPAEASPKDTLAVLAGCHSVILAEGGLAGDPLECAALASMGWTVDAAGDAHPLGPSATPPVMAGSGSKPNGGLLPSSHAGAASDRARVLRRWPFASALRRMTTVVQMDGELRALTKGAPEAVAELLRVVPEGYNDAATALSLAGARVIALAWKRIKLDVPPSKLRAAVDAVSRDDVETGLTSAGFLVLDCPLKPDSADVVEKLRMADQAVVMITGDHPLTAVAVSRMVSILPAPIGRTLLPAEAPRGSATGIPASPAAAPGTSVVRILEAAPHSAAAGAVPVAGASPASGMGIHWRVVTQAHGRSPSERVEPFDAALLGTSALEVAFPGQELCVTGGGLRPMLEAADAEARLAAGLAPAGGSHGVTASAEPGQVSASGTADGTKPGEEAEDGEDEAGGGSEADGQLRWATMGPMQRAVARLCAECTVFARVAPTQKERIITYLNALGRGTLMCGDGTNDVGALKQASIGVSIVSDPELEDRLETIEGERSALIAAAQQLGPRGAAATPEAGSAVSSAEQALAQRQQAKLDREAERKADARRKRVVTGPAAFESDSDEPAAASAAGGALTAPAKAKTGPKRSMWTDPVKLVKQQLKMSNIPRDSPEGRRRLAAARMQREFRDLEREMAVEASTVQFGDASIAAPFTSKRPSPSVALDIMLQGRCTLVTTHQMFRILAVNSLVASYTLSALYLHGARTGDTQATVTGMTMSAFFMMMTFTKPLPQLSRAKPDTTVFKPHLLISVFGQFIIHLCAMMLAVHLCEPYVEFVPNPFLLKEAAPAVAEAAAAVAGGIMDDASAAAAAAAAAAADDEDGDDGWGAGSFAGAGAAGLSAAAAGAAMGGASASTADAASVLGGAGVDEVTMDGDFKPNVLNSVVFLLTTVQQATTFAVNYRGRPFLPGFWENLTFSRGLLALYAVAFAAAMGWEDLGEMLQLVPMPTPELGQAVFGIMATDVLLCFGLEHFLRTTYRVPTE